MISSTMDFIPGRMYAIVHGSRARKAIAKECNGKVYLYSCSENMPYNLDNMLAHGDFDRIVPYGEYMTEMGLARKNEESQRVVEFGISCSEGVEESIREFLEIESVLADNETLALAAYVIRDRTMSIARFREEIARLRK